MTGRGRPLFGVLTLAAVLVLTGCVSQPPPRPQTDRDRVARYFGDLNAAGKKSPEAQQEFLDASRHPDFRGGCDLQGLTLDIYAALSTLRPDPNWAPQGGKHPRGDVYVLGVSLTLRRAGATIADQIDSERVAVLNNRVYAFTPCPTN
jgi:hypothetical protein